MRIRKELENPTTIHSFVRDTSVLVAEVDDPLRNALGSMIAHSFSQVPVYKSNEYAGLLTTNSVARWLASQIDDSGELFLEGVSVGTVLDFAEGFERAEHVKRRESVASIVERMMKVNRPVAMIVTENGLQAEKPLGVIVPDDLSHLIGILPRSSYD